MKMDLQKHIDEYKALAERVEQGIVSKKRLLERFSSDVMVVRMLAGELDIFRNVLRETKAIIGLLEDMKGANK